MRPDERELLFFVAQGKWPRDYEGIPAKRIAYLCGKWARKGWYECGVSLVLGWLTDEGKAKAQRIAEEA